MDPGMSFWLVFVILLTFGAINGMVQATVFGLAGQLPGKYTAALMIGNGVSGIFSNAVRVIFLLVLPGDKNMFASAFIFFSISALFLLVCSFCF